MIKKKEKRN